MEANHPPEELFLKAHARFYRSLKQTYEVRIEKASDKSYAQNYFSKTLFTENSSIPRYSVFFHSLISTFDHYQKLGEDNALELTLESLSTIREMTVNIIEQTFIIHSSMSERRYQLNWLYLEAVEENNASVLSLIDTERRLLKYSDTKVVVLLALHQATEELKDEFLIVNERSEQSLSSSEPFLEGEPSIGSKLTRSQQVLIAYYNTQ